MKSGIMLYSVADKFLEESIRAGSETTTIYTEPIRFDPNKFVEMVKDKDLAITMHGPLRREDRGYVQEMVERLSPKVYAVTYDFPRKKIEKGIEVDFEKINEEFLSLKDFFEKQNVYFGLEDFPFEPSDLERIDEAVKNSPYYGMLLDIGHLNIRIIRSHYYRGLLELGHSNLRIVTSPDLSYENLDVIIRNIPVPIMEVHVHDNKGEEDNHQYIGFGNNRFEDHARALIKAGFNGVSSLEIDFKTEEQQIKAGESLRIWKGLIEKYRSQSQPR